MIYIRVHEAYGDACKLGKAANLPDRDSQYVTGELKRGKFIAAYKVDDNMSRAELLLQQKFRKYNIYFDGGTEFYHQNIIPLVAPALTEFGINFTALTEAEIANLCYSNHANHSKYGITARPDQKIIINETLDYLAAHDKVLLCLMCGVGKTLISLWIAQKLQAKTIVVGVPNKLLLMQWERSIRTVFSHVDTLWVHSGISIDIIKKFITKPTDNIKIIITTYHSAFKLNECEFDVKINDEAHHLTGNAGNFVKMLDIVSKKQISLTATPKIVENGISNDNMEYFGETLINRSLLWAINNKIVCDYVIQTIIVDADQIDEAGDNKRLYLAAFAALKSLSQDAHHLLIYANNIDNANKINTYVEILSQHFNIPGLYTATYDSKKPIASREYIIQQFTQSNKAIISCVYCLGEGWDLPLLDGVVFAENMTSSIRIVQSALRACRLDKNDPSKKNKIILPIVNNDDWSDENKNTDLKKVKEIIYQMGLEDENIMEKIKIYKTNISKTNEKTYTYSSDDVDIEKLRLKTINRSQLKITYNKAKKILALKKIQSKASYLALCELDHRFNPDPQEHYGKQFLGWVDYLTIEQKYYTLVECRAKIYEYLAKYPDLNKLYLNIELLTNKLCEIDTNFPPQDFWCDYYKINHIKDIISYKKRSKILF